MLIVTIIMYLNSLAHFAAVQYGTLGVGVLGKVLMGTVTHQKWFGDWNTIDWAMWVEGGAALVNVLLSDIIVVWRAWLIWNKSKRVLAVSTVLSLATVVIGIWSLISEGGITTEDNDLMKKFILTTYGTSLAGTSKPPILPLTLSLCILSLASNLWGFVLIACKAWSHRRLVKDLHNKEFRRSLVGRALALLLESGGVYSLLWAFFITGIASSLFGTNQDMHSPEEILTVMVVYITAMYPNAILLIADLQKSAYNETFAYQTLPHSNAAGPSTIKSLADLLEELPWDNHAPAARLQPGEVSAERLTLVDIRLTYVESLLEEC
ncbi:hypothetical protein BC834DRAFT_910532 [Gloeopeniophorella convolvens]|nr:hypothetical protein BC834DRAFT_910532 [Gloeopeniophorella convolvens]